MEIFLGISDDYVYTSTKKQGSSYDEDPTKPVVYYGYEEHDPDGDWAFVIKVNKKVIVTYSTKELLRMLNESNADPERLFIAGMYKYITENSPIVYT